MRRRVPFSAVLFPVFALSLALSLVLSLGACGRKESEESEKSREADASDRAPSVSLTTLEGKTYAFGPGDKQVTLVVFWATWCGPCLMEIPTLVELHDRYRDRAFRVVSINLDDPEGQKMAAIYQRYAINYPLLMDDGTSERKFGELRALPTSFLIGRDGKMSRKLEGLYPPDVLESLIVDLL